MFSILFYSFTFISVIEFKYPIFEKNLKKFSIKFKGVTCLRRIDCRCDRVIGRGPHCGNQLQGLDCGPNIIFMCSLIGGPSPRDACPNGCNRGKCIIGVQNVNKTESDPEIVNSENVTEEQQKNPNSNVTQNPEIVNLDNVTEEQQKSLNTNATQNPELVNLDNVTEEQQKNSNANVTQNPELVNLDNVTEEQQKSLNTNVTQNPELVNSEDIKEEQQKSLNKNATQNPELVISDNVTEERQKSFNTNITRPTEETEP